MANLQVQGTYLTRQWLDVKQRAPTPHLQLRAAKDATSLSDPFQQPQSCHVDGVPSLLRLPVRAIYSLY